MGPKAKNVPPECAHCGSAGEPLTPGGELHLNVCGTCGRLHCVKCGQESMCDICYQIATEPKDSQESASQESAASSAASTERGELDSKCCECKKPVTDDDGFLAEWSDRHECMKKTFCAKCFEDCEGFLQEDNWRVDEWPSQTKARLKEEAPMKNEVAILTALGCKKYKARGECFGDMLVVYSALARIVPPNMGLHLPNLVSEPRQVFFIDFWCNVPLEKIRECWFKEHDEGTDLTYLLRTLQPYDKFTGECDDKPSFYTEDDLALANKK